jgi:predicted transcriptional regulator YheO
MPDKSDRKATFDLLGQLAVGLHRLFGSQCEVVIHDFTDFERSIIHIEGNVTNRSIGGAATDLLLTRASSGETDQDLYNYLTSLPGGRLMKSSTIFLRDEQGEAYGALCINFDISAFVSMRQLLGDFISTEEPEEVSELLSDDIATTIHNIITDTLYEIRTDLPIMTRDDKIDLIARLDAKGVFKVKKAVPILADQLGLSRATVYNYLGEARGQNNPNGDED